MRPKINEKQIKQLTFHIRYLEHYWFVYCFYVCFVLINYCFRVVVVGGVRCSSVVRVFANGAMGRRIDPSWWTIELFIVPASAP